MYRVEICFAVLPHSDRIAEGNDTDRRQEIMNGRRKKILILLTASALLGGFLGASAPPQIMATEPVTESG
jgi:hypothetical protein